MEFNIVGGLGKSSWYFPDRIPGANMLKRIYGKIGVGMQFTKRVIASPYLEFNLDGLQSSRHYKEYDISQKSELGFPQLKIVEGNSSSELISKRTTFKQLEARRTPIIINYDFMEPTPIKISGLDGKPITVLLKASEDVI